MDNFIRIQKGIKDNTEDLQAFVRDLRNWKIEMNKMEEELRCEIKKREEQLTGLLENGTTLTEETTLKQQALNEKEIGNQCVKKKQWIEAVHHYTEAIQLYSKDAVFYVNRALCYLKMNKFIDAEEDCSTALRLDNTYIKAYVRRSLARMEQCKVLGAYCDLINALKIEPNNSDIQKELKKVVANVDITEGGMVIGENKYPNYEDLEKYLEEKAINVKEKGNQCVKTKNWAEAINHYTRAIQYYNLDATFYANRALCYLKTERFIEAENDCSTALSLDHTYVKAYGRRATARMALKWFSKARWDLLKAMEFDPTNSEVLHRLNDLNNDPQYEAENWETIEDSSEFEMIEEFDFNVPDKWGSLYWSMTAANVPCTVESTDNQVKALAENFLGVTSISNGALKEAIAHFNKAIKCFPDDPVFFANRALCHMIRNKLVRAEADCTTALGLDDKYIKALVRRAFIRIALKKYCKAHNDFTDALELEPDNQFIMQELTSVNRKIISGEWQTSNTVDENIEFEIDSADEDNGEECLTREVKNSYIPKSCQLDQNRLRNNMEDTQSTSTNIPDTGLTLQNKRKIAHPSTTIHDSSVFSDQLAENVNMVVGSIPNDVFKIPASFFEFYRDWSKIQNNSYHQFLYLVNIPGTKLRSLFNESLDSDILSQILYILDLEFSKQKTPAYEYLLGLSNVKRFNTIVSFCSEADKIFVRNICKRCEEANECSRDEIDALKEKFAV